MVLKTLLTTLILAPTILFAQQTVTPLYGEKNFDIYSGPNDPLGSVEMGYGNYVFEDVNKFGNYFENHTEIGLSWIVQDMKELQTAMMCPDPELAEETSYLRYLYRLSALSYIDEHLEALKLEAKKLRLGNVCDYNLSEVLKTCRPNGADMKLFVQSASAVANNFDSPTVSFKFSFKEYFQEWEKNFYEGDRSGSVKKRLADQKKVSFQSQKLSNAFKKICEEDQLSFTQICSEKDELLGLSSAREAYHAIIASDALAVINEDGNGRGCLLRYSEMSSGKEKRLKNVEAIISGVYENIRSKQLWDNISGRLFPAGSLKRFMKDGLGSIFVTPKKEVLKTPGVKKNTPRLVLTPLAPEPLKQIFKKKPKKKVGSKKMVPKPAPKKSHFLETSLARKEFGLDSAKVNMLEFKYDFVFNSKMISFLNDNLEVFNSRKGINELKENDKFGTKKAPVPLLYIKYLIDQKSYQALFNLTDIIGNKFFVLNNIDDPELRESSNYISLDFDPSVEGSWQIYILKF